MYGIRKVRNGLRFRENIELFARKESKRLESHPPKIKEQIEQNYTTRWFLAWKNRPHTTKKNIQGHSIRLEKSRAVLTRKEQQDLGVHRLASKQLGHYIIRLIIKLSNYHHTVNFLGFFLNP